MVNISELASTAGKAITREKPKNARELRRMVLSSVDRFEKQVVKAATPDKMTPKPRKVIIRENAGVPIKRDSVNARTEQAIDILIKDGKLSPEFKEMFMEIKHLEGEEFIDKSYELMVKHLGYEGAAPELIKKIDPTGQNHFYNLPAKISIHPEGSKAELLGEVWHEMTHFIQDSDCIRTEGRGYEAYIRAMVQRFANNKDDVLDRFGKPIEQVTAQELEEVYQEGLKSINRDLYDRVIAKKGIIKSGTPAATKTDQYLEAIANYKSPKSLKTKEDQEKLLAYILNIKEQEANNIGSRIRKEYKEFEKVL